MKVWPFAAALAEGGCKPPHAALAEDRRGERCGKGARDASGGDREDGAQSPFLGIAGDVSLLNQVTSEPGRSRAARDESGGVSVFPARRCPACRRREPGLRLLQGTWEGTPRYCGPRSGGPARGSCRIGCAGEAVSTVAGRADGPARSSCEAPAGRGGGGAKGPGHLWCVRSINREWVFREELHGQAEAIR